MDLFLQSTTVTHYYYYYCCYISQAENTAGNVLTQMQTQRQQLKGAHNNVWEMRQAAEKAKQDITSLIQKARKKKLRLQMIAAALAGVDFLLFIRLIQCGGSFFCKSRANYNDYYNGNN
jgi:hypothetical protein